MKAKKSQYRIMRSRATPGHFEVQHRDPWWPFWRYADTAPTLKQAREAAQGHATTRGVVEYLGELTPAAADE